MIINELIEKIKDGADVMGLSKDEAARDAANEYVVDLINKRCDGDPRFDNAMFVVKAMGMGGLWRGVDIAVVIADLAMNHREKIFAEKKRG